MAPTQVRAFPSCAGSPAATLAAMIGATALVATTATAQVVVTDIPQIAGSTLYENCVLSGNGNFVAMTTNEATPRLVRWTASSNTFLPFNAPPGTTVPHARHVTDIGSITGGTKE